MSEKQRNLLEYKEKLLNNLRQCEFEIEAAKASQNRKRTFIDSDSDSDEEPQHHLQIYSFNELKDQYSSLNTCLKATKELTDLIVLESNTNVISKPDDLENHSIVTEDGVWKEVIAECKIDLVAFSIFFYQHQPKRKFSAPTFHNIKVNIIKKAHEKELEKSVLKDVTKPSDVIQIIKSFAHATRSRRSSLSRIAEKYPDGQVFMQLLPEGGYVIKCCNLLQLEWHLRNKLSAIAPFYHKMCFNLECMDIEYIKEIKKIYKIIQNPSLTTDERTALLMKIINVCLEAEKLNDTHVSDDAPSVTSRRTTLDACDINHQDIPERREKDECEVMAPPKCIPKKTRKTPQKSQHNINTQKKYKSNLVQVMDNRVGKASNTEREITSKSAGNTDSILPINKNKVRKAGNTEQKITSKSSGNTDNALLVSKNKLSKVGNTEKEITSKSAGNTDIMLLTNKNKVKKTGNPEKEITSKSASNTDSVLPINKNKVLKVGNTKKEITTKSTGNTGNMLSTNKNKVTKAGNTEKEITSKLAANKVSKVGNTEKEITKSTANCDRTLATQKENSNVKADKIVSTNKSKINKAGNTEKTTATQGDITKTINNDKIPSTNKNKLNKPSNTEKKIITSTKTLPTAKPNTDKMQSRDKAVKDGNTDKILAIHKEQLKNNKASNSGKILPSNIVKSTNYIEEEQIKTKTNSEKVLATQAQSKDRTTKADNTVTTATRKENINKKAGNTGTKTSKVANNIKKIIGKNTQSKIPKFVNSLRMSPRNPLKSSMNKNVLVKKTVFTIHNK